MLCSFYVKTRTSARWQWHWPLVFRPLSTQKSQGRQRKSPNGRQSCKKALHFSQQLLTKSPIPCKLRSVTRFAIVLLCSKVPHAFKKVCGLLADVDRTKVEALWSAGVKHAQTWASQAWIRSSVCLELNHFNYRILDVQGFWSSYGPLVTLHGFAMDWKLWGFYRTSDSKWKTMPKQCKGGTWFNCIVWLVSSRFCPRCGKLLCTVLTLKSWLVVLSLRGGALEMSAVLQTSFKLFQSCK